MKKRSGSFLTKLEEEDVGEAYSAADEPWHWPKPNAALGTAHWAGI